MATDYAGIVAAAAGIVSGVAVVFGATRQQKKAETAAPAHPPIASQTPLPPVPEDPAGQREFMAILQRDNHDLREELAGFRRTLTEMKTDLEADKAWKVTFLDALGRWLARVFAGWDHTRPFPLPEGDDLVTLQDVIPRS